MCLFANECGKWLNLCQKTITRTALPNAKQSSWLKFKNKTKLRKFNIEYVWTRKVSAEIEIITARK